MNQIIREIISDYIKNNIDSNMSLFNRYKLADFFYGLIPPDKEKTVGLIKLNTNLNHRKVLRYIILHKILSDAALANSIKHLAHISRDGRCGKLNKKQESNLNYCLLYVNSLDPDMLKEIAEIIH